MNAIVQQRLGLSLPRPTLRSVHETAAGNPFFSLELARATAEGGASLSSTLRELVGARIAALPAETRRALAAAAALADPTLDLVGAAIGKEPGGALAAAFEREVVGVSDGRIRFAHPLLAAAAYASAGSRVRDLHTVLAGLVSEPEERARHLALAARGPDADVAAALDEAAGLAKARGAPIAAAELLEKARALTPADDPAAFRRAVAAARRYFEAGDARRARALLDDALPELAGVERAEALIVLANVRSYDDDISAAVELLEEAIAVGAAESRVAGAAHELLAGIFFRLRERFPESVDHARAAAAIARDTGDVHLLAGALGAQLVSEATLGRPEASETLAAALAVGDAGQATRVMGGAGFQTAVVRMWWEQLDEAVAGFAALRSRAELIGDESSIPYIRRPARAGRVPARGPHRRGGVRERGGGSGRAGGPGDARRLRARAARPRGCLRGGGEARTHGGAASARASREHDRPPRGAVRDGGARAARALARARRRGGRGARAARRLRARARDARARPDALRPRPRRGARRSRPARRGGGQPRVVHRQRGAPAAPFGARLRGPRPRLPRRRARGHARRPWRASTRPLPTIARRRSRSTAAAASSRSAPPAAVRRSAVRRASRCWRRASSSAPSARGCGSSGPRRSSPASAAAPRPQAS